MINIHTRSARCQGNDMPCTVSHRTRSQAVILMAVTLAAVFLFSACSDSDSSQRPGERTIHLQATEVDTHRAADRFPKDYPNATRSAFPHYFGDPDDHEDRGGAPGYYLFLSDEDEYRIGSYMWLPQSDFIVYQGQKVTLEMLGVRGTTHHSKLIDPDGEELSEFTVYRGGLEVVEFTADKLGVYKLICLEHQPTMTLHIHALPAQ